MPITAAGPNHRRERLEGRGKDDTFRQGAINNVKAFVDSIRTGKLLNVADDAVTSTLTAILGRTAAYQGGTVTWQLRCSSATRNSRRT